MAHVNLSASKNQKQSFFQRKMEAYRAFGKAQTRPQANFRNYLIEKRKLNLGFIVRQNTNITNIRCFRLQLSDLAATPSTFAEDPRIICPSLYTMVETEETFKVMIQDLQQTKEISLDLEANLDHSYYGMTCLIQIATYNNVYLVDPFPLYDKIKTELKKILESPNILKLVHGGDNDYIALNRDFGISMAGVLDLQFMHQRLLLACILWIQENKLAQIQLHDFMWRSVTDEDGNLLANQRLAKASTNRIGFKDLAQIYFPSYPRPPDATLADWRIRPLADTRMINYAFYDVYLLLHVWVTMKKVINVLPCPDIELRFAVEKTSKLLEKHFSPRPTENLDKKLMAANIVPVDPKTFQLIYNFRNNRAKIVDESEEQLLKLTEIDLIIRQKPITEEQLEFLVQKGRPIPSESIQATSKTLLKLLTEGELFYQKMIEIKCHICNGNYKFPHAAWGCIEKYSQQAVNSFMSRPENSIFKQKEYERRKRNWHAKRGENVPYPYPPPT